MFAVEGDKYNKLTVIKLIERKFKNNPKYSCKCDCGNEKTEQAYNRVR